MISFHKHPQKEAHMAVRVGRRSDKPGWWVFINHQGRRTKKCFGEGKQGKNAATMFAERLSARLKWAETSGEPIVLSQPENKLPTVGVYLADWLKVYAHPHCKASTFRGYKRAVEKHLVPSFGHLPLNALKREHVKRFIAQQVEVEPDGPGRRKARWTIQGYLVPLKAAYNQAVEDGLVTFNPAARLGRLLRGRQDRRAHIQPLTREEVRALLHTAVNHSRVLHPVLLCAVRAGLRLGELIGLQWGDIDFHGRFIEVRHSVVLGQETTTKSHKIRRVEMSQQLHDTLKRLKEVRQLDSMSQGKPMEPYVFLSPEGVRWDERNLRRGWYRSLAKAGIRSVRFHDLRHTFISLLIEQGAHPKYIQEQAGHSSIQVTMDTYGHLFPNRDRGWTDKLDDEREEGGLVPSAHPALKPAEEVVPNYA
jgi:integrase